MEQWGLTMEIKRALGSPVEYFKKKEECAPWIFAEKVAVFTFLLAEACEKSTLLSGDNNVKHYFTVILQ